MTEQQLERARSDAAKRLTAYIFLLRYKRQPYAWEMALVLALLSGELKITRPVDGSLLRPIHHIADDVSLALDLPAWLSPPDDTK